MPQCAARCNWVDGAAGAALFLASDDAAWITGVVIDVAGGSALTWLAGRFGPRRNLIGGHPVSCYVTTSDFESFYAGTSRRLLRYTLGLTGDLPEAQDLTQEAYARAWQRWRRLSRYEDPEGWLRLVVYRLAADRWRWLGVRRGAAAPQPRTTDPPGEEHVMLVRALNELPLVQRRALALHYLLDRSVADIAAETGANLNTVKSWLSRGRANLATALGYASMTGGDSGVR